MAAFVSLPHVLRIKRYVSSRISIQHPYLYLDSQNCPGHVADLSANQVYWTPRVSRDISAGFI